MNSEEYGRYDPMDNVAKEIKALRPHVRTLNSITSKFLFLNWVFSYVSNDIL
jgi:hypothetical protein